MELGSFFLILALFLLVAFFVSRPLWVKRAPAASPTKRQLARSASDHERSTLLAERDRILNALQELDFDYTLGKIPPEDYPTQRSMLVQRGADVLRQLDTLQSDAPATQTQPTDRIEAAIAARRADAAVTSKPPASLQSVGGLSRRQRRPTAAVAAPDDQLETMLASRRRARQEKATGFCPQCGRPLQKSDKFCPKCGAKI